MKNKAYLICSLRGSSPFLDNLYGKCSICHRAIQFRPTSPKNATKICIHCFDRKIATKEKDLVIATYKEQADELKRILKN